MPTLIHCPRLESSTLTLPFSQHPKVVLFPDHHDMRHAEKQPRLDDARDGQDLLFEAARIRKRGDFAIDDVIAVVADEQLAVFAEGNRRAAHVAQPPLAKW